MRNNQSCTKFIKINPFFSIKGLALETLDFNQVS
jgi:hypothetical protein